MARSPRRERDALARLASSDVVTPIANDGVTTDPQPPPRGRRRPLVRPPARARDTTEACRAAPPDAAAAAARAALELVREEVARVRALLEVSVDVLTFVC